MNKKEQVNHTDEITIVYEDKDILAVNKPAGVVVNRAQSVKGVTLQDWLEENVSEIRAIIKNGEYPDNWEQQIPESFTGEFGTPQETFLQRSGIAHRLDKETSGVMLVAKHPGSLLNLLDQFKNRTVHKQYVCLVHGKFALSTGEINVPLGRRSGNRKLFGVVADGRPAVTHYEVEAFYPTLDIQRIISQTTEKKKRFSLYETGFSFVRCFPKTGRTHQIRVHMAHLSHPIVGDSSYAGKKRIKLDEIWCKRHFLHAQKIEFTHPSTSEKMVLSAELSKDLQEVLTYVS
jgi:23S rRNA pseudouridine1911/1915/1917 synthase